ncbi:MAG: TetR family transcriptional regulator [Boseongicola sp.]|nr:MAG: TetR family transcriptional regulator [Boseongicola sp.]
MAKATKEKRDLLRVRLIDIAERHVREDGIASLRARALAAEAECAVGAIYNVFEDMTGLILAVNGRTFRALGSFVTDRVAAAKDDPTEQLIAMATGYLDFAHQNPMLWRALFDVEMSTLAKVPEWYLDELSRLFGIIAKPLATLNPTADAESLDLMTRALFSSIHGIVLLGLENRISGVPQDRLSGMIEFILRNAASGPRADG